MTSPQSAITASFPKIQTRLFGTPLRTAAVLLLTNGLSAGAQTSAMSGGFLTGSCWQICKTACLYKNYDAPDPKNANCVDSCGNDMIPLPKGMTAKPIPQTCVPKKLPKDPRISPRLLFEYKPNDPIGYYPTEACRDGYGPKYMNALGNYLCYPKNGSSPTSNASKTTIKKDPLDSAPLDRSEGRLHRLPHSHKLNIFSENGGSGGGGRQYSGQSSAENSDPFINDGSHISTEHAWLMTFGYPSPLIKNYCSDDNPNAPAYCCNNVEFFFAHYFGCILVSANGQASLNGPYGWSGTGKKIPLVAPGK